MAPFTDDCQDTGRPRPWREMAGSGETLTRRQLRVLPVLLAADSIVEAAKLTRTGERTLQRWLTLPAFQRALRDLGKRAAELAVARLHGHAADAVTTLAAGMRGQRKAPAIRAAIAVLSLLQAGDMADVMDRLDELERSTGGVR